MIQCEACEFFNRRPDGTPELACDPFATIKEPECLAKWHLLKLSVVANSHEATLRFHRRLAPLQERLFRHMEREIEDVDEADAWKRTDEDDEDEAWQG